jgi:mRNA-degrading endonuclease RelE of RelBE toxin-antitoxin system
MKASKSHRWCLIIHPEAQRAFDQLPSSVKRGIFRQLRELLLSDDPYREPFVEMLKAPKFGRIRKFRVGDYRILFLFNHEPIEFNHHWYQGEIHLLDIRNRKDAY